MNDIVARILLFLACASVMVGTMGWLEMHTCAEVGRIVSARLLAPSSPHDGPGGHHVERLAVACRSLPLSHEARPRHRRPPIRRD